MRTVGWISWVVEAAVVALLLIVAPVSAAALFLTGHPHDGWKATGAFAFGLVYALALALDLIKRPWHRGT